MFRRLTALMVTLLVASLLIFLLLEILPGDPAAVILGVGAQEDTLRALRAELGLDLPAPVRYLNWLGEVLQGNLGRSYTYDTPVQELLLNRVELSLPLALLAILLSTGIAIPLGVFAASRHRKVADTGIMGFAQAAILARVTRSSVLETVQEDYIRTARAKGLSRSQALWRHAVRNALIPVVTILGLQLSFLLAGTIIIENVFYLPGVGRLLFQAIAQRDLMVVKNLVLVLAATVVLINFLVDLLYAVLDPRLRLGFHG